jgi:hypothetical protein
MHERRIMKRQMGLRRVTAILHRFDHALGRGRRVRDVLIEARTPVYLGVLGPIAERLAARGDVNIWFTSEYPDRIRPLVPSESFLTHAEAHWRRFALYLNADPWAAVRLRRCRSRVNFFHGVAGKYDLDQPAGLPMGFDAYDRVAFINHGRMERYLDAGIVTRQQAVLVGYPKLDRLTAGAYDASTYRASLGLDPSRPVALYAPTYSEASSLHVAGEAIIRSLTAANFNVIIKLHDRSLDDDPRYSGGVDWRGVMRGLEEPGRIRYIETTDACPALAAADVMVTDHSSIGFEYLVLDRPLIVFDAPDLMQTARINPEKVELLRSAAVVSRTAGEVGVLARQEMLEPARLSALRRLAAGEVFYRPGGATDRAIEVIDGLMARRRGSGPEPVADGRSALGGVS